MVSKKFTVPRARQITFWTLTILAFAYILARAILLSFTIDEAMTFNYVLDLWPDVLRANDHVLNTQAMKLTRWLFGDSEWSMRLPNMLTFIPYAWGTWQIASKVKSYIFFLVTIVLLYAHPTFLEFFGLARGYGMGIGLILPAIVCFWKSFEEGLELRKVYRCQILTALFAGMALLAYAALLNVYIALIGLMVLVQFRDLYRSNWKKGWMALIVSGIISVLFFGKTVSDLWNLKEAEELFFGTATYGEWFENTYRYYFKLGGSGALVESLAFGGLCLFFILSIILIIKFKKIPTLLQLALALFFISIFGWILEHEFFDSKLPRGRTNIVNYLLFSLWVIGTMVYAEQSGGRWRKIGSGLAIIIGLGMASNLFLQMNVDMARNWKFSARMKEVALTAQDIAQHWPQPVEMEKHPLYRSNINYYIRTRDMNILADMSFNFDLKKELLLVRTRDLRIDTADPRFTENYVKVAEYDKYEVALYARKDVFEHAVQNGFSIEP